MRFPTPPGPEQVARRIVAALEELAEVDRVLLDVHLRNEQRNTRSLAIMERMLELQEKRR